LTSPQHSREAAIRLGPVEVRRRSRPYIIAEIGVNHGGSLDLACRLIELAAEGGADAAKFQTYKAEHLASRHSPAYWDTTKEPTTSQFELFKKYDGFGAGDYEKLAAHCRAVGIEFLSTPFDEAAVDYLDELMAFYKVASADVTNIPLLRKIGAKAKPVVMSTGAANRAEVDAAVTTLLRSGCPSIALLHCVLNYPTSNAAAQLGMIQGLLEMYPQHVIGYSDHTVPDAEMTAVTVAYLLGATILEKHFTHDKSLPGNDHYHAMDRDDLRTLRRRLDTVGVLVGSQREKTPLSTEDLARMHARRSIVLRNDVPAGVALTAADLTCKRPGTGISADRWDDVVGLKTARAMTADTILSWNDLIVPVPAASE
jgi:sialic acid synthase SpsE